MPKATVATTIVLLVASIAVIHALVLIAEVPANGHTSMPFQLSLQNLIGFLIFSLPYIILFTAAHISRSIRSARLWVFAISWVVGFGGSMVIVESLLSISYDIIGHCLIDSIDENPMIPVVTLICQFVVSVLTLVIAFVAVRRRRSAERQDQVTSLV